MNDIAIIIDDTVREAGTTTPDAELIQSFAAHALGGVMGELSIRIVDAETMREWNHQYRGKDAATNVLSFPAHDNGENGDNDAEGVYEAVWQEGYLGDIALCAEVIHQESEAQKRPLFEYWAHLVFHGVLHLLGHEHETEAGATEMQALENNLMAEWRFYQPWDIIADT